MRRVSNFEIGWSQGWFLTKFFKVFCSCGNSDGSIRTLRIQGAFSDALSWFGAEDAYEDVKGYMSGKKSLGDIAKDSALSGPIRTINALRPDVKVAGEVIGGQGWYPDPFNPRPIKDKLEHVARTFSLDSVYNWLAGKPKRGDSTGERLVNDLLNLGFYTSDPRRIGLL